MEPSSSFGEVRAHWDGMYARPAGTIPWEIDEVPPELEALLRSGLTPCRALDMGCGTGNHSRVLARLGFAVSGIDCAPRALEIAKKRAAAEGLAIDFVEGDVLRACDAVDGRFGFILDYSLLHHIPTDATEAYAAQQMDLLEEGGSTLLVCYSEEHERAQGDTSAEGTYGNRMYFRTATEIAAAFAACGARLLSHRKGRLGKGGKHPAHVFVFGK